MQIDRKVIKPTVSSVPATESSYNCPDGYKLAESGYDGGGTFFSSGGNYTPQYDVRIKGKGYNYTESANGHQANESYKCVEQVEGNGND